MSISLWLINEKLNIVSIASYIGISHLNIACKTLEYDYFFDSEIEKNYKIFPQIHRLFCNGISED